MINHLSNEIEEHINNNDEERCTSLLTQRLQLLEQLVTLGAFSDDSTKPKDDELIKFLISIQNRDNQYINIVEQQQKWLSTECAKQVNNTRAIKAYHKVL